MKVLGIKPAIGKKSPLNLWCRHNGGAALLDDNGISAIVEEERFTREKRAKHTFPANSIRTVLASAQLTLDDIDVVAVGRDPRKTIKKAYHEPLQFLPTRFSDWGAIQNIGTLAAAYTCPNKEIKMELKQMPGDETNPRYVNIPHHRCHMASARYCSGFDEQLVFTIDGEGEYESTVVWQDGERVQTLPRRHSLGGLFRIGATYLGFDPESAGKVMGLAAYGEHRDDFAAVFDQLVEVTETGYAVNLDYQQFLREEMSLQDYFGPRRAPEEELQQHHKDFAFHLQKTVEKAVKRLVDHYTSKTGIRNVSLAGGVAMNCKMNKEIREMDCVDTLFVQPGADDRGICLGAALEAYNQDGSFSQRMTHVSYGTRYASSDIEPVLERNKLDYQRTEEIEQRVADLLAEGNIVGWFQGRMEYGARALGNRSILANPTDERYRDKVNTNVKSREAWRPFAPSILHEKRGRYLKNSIVSPFMIQIDEVTAQAKEEIPAVVHVDGTTRPQTVKQPVNPRFHRVISEFEHRTGVPAVLNTSFNVSGEPIVESPDQAIRDFFSTGLDALALGDFLLLKDQVRSR